jgi:hypothetical protein
MNNEWFAVDKEGLRKLIDHANKGRLIGELVQNALDENVAQVEITLKPMSGRSAAELAVTDDVPEGFKDLSHAYTVFAESAKKGRPEQRGRFNLGEKLVLAICESATICSTTGTVNFDNQNGRQLQPRRKRERGTEFRAIVRITRDELSEALACLRTLLIPESVTVTFNGETLQPRKPFHSFETTLETEIADEAGLLRRRLRRTCVELFEPAPNEVPSIYELGLPVVPTGDKWHVNIGQKVPLNMNRDNVPPAFLRAVRIAVLNENHQRLEQEDGNSDWVRQATSDAACSNEAIGRALDLRFGKKRVSFDPSDREANHNAVAHGFTLVHSSQLSRTEWENARRADAIQPAGKKFPTPKPYGDDPNAEPEQLIGPDEQTPGMRRLVAYSQALARKLLNAEIRVDLSRENNFRAAFGGGRLVFNLGTLGHSFFDQGLTEDVDELILHEFGHHFEGNHLSEGYHNALTRLGAKLKHLALAEPEFFRQYDGDAT